MACRTVAAMAAGMAGRMVAVKGWYWVEQTGDERVGTTAEIKEYLMVVTKVGKTGSPSAGMMELLMADRMAEMRER